MSRTPLLALVISLSLATAACSADVAVTATRSDSNIDQASNDQADPSPDAGDPGGPGGGTTPDAPDTTDAPDTDTPDTENTAETTVPDAGSGPTTSDPTPAPPLIVDPDAINFGNNKPERPYDDFVLATVSDLEIWWEESYPAVYGEPWLPLQGDVFAAFPERADDIPGCGNEPRTSYDDVQQFVAFYCGLGDFIVYDDGEDGLLASLADSFGSGTIGIVLAHEYGHAIQQRSGVLDRRLPTVTTEQQADCFAGAWAARASRGEGNITFSDADVRSGLIAMLEVRDPVGLDQFVNGGHGSGFDRVGAFQTGFVAGPERCGELIDDPLPLVPNQFNDRTDQLNEGNAPFGFDDDELLGFLVNDLNLFWSVDAGVTGFDPITIVPVQSVSDATCPALQPGLELGAALCPDSDTVYLNEPVARSLYGEAAFGDFSIGYLIGVAWAEAAQIALDSPLTGEPRQLANDCLAGAWVQTVIPVDFRLPQPRAEGRTAVVSPGDLDEAIRTAILIGDVGADDDVLGTPFEKIDAFRTGVLGGLDSCTF